MITIDVNNLRHHEVLFNPGLDFDSKFIFYYDETNNFRKFYVKDEISFNYPFDLNFVLGGVLYQGNAPDISSLYRWLKLQSSDIKLKHIAQGDFSNCLRSKRLSYFLEYLFHSDLFMHYSTVNIFYYSLVDIVDSAIANSQIAMELGMGFSRGVKNDLFKLCRREKAAIVKQMHFYQYPNIKKESTIDFIDSLTSLLESYQSVPDFHVGLTCLKQILKESREKNSLPFLTNNEDFILVKDFLQFYLRPIYLFKNSTHYFDGEPSIEQKISQFEFKDNETLVKSFSFIESNKNLFTQTSDIITGLVGKFFEYLNSNSEEDLQKNIEGFNEAQLNNLALFFNLIDKSDFENKAFIHNIASDDEMTKFSKLYSFAING